MKKSQGFTIIEILIASAIGLISLGVIYAAHQAGWRTFQFNQKRMEVINKLCLSMDRIKKEVREGKEFIDSGNFSDYFSISIPNSFLAFTTNDTTAIAFYIKDDDNKTCLYKQVSSPDEKIVTVSFDPKIFSKINLEVSKISASSARIDLTANWAYRRKTRQEGVSSAICLRNWEKEW